MFFYGSCNRQVLKKLYVHITTEETGSLVMRKKQTEMRLQMKDVVELHRR